MITDFPDPEAILAENARRLDLINRPFDPVSGKNSIGSRIPLHLPDYILPMQYIPESMLADPLVKLLLDTGSIAKAASLMNQDPEEMAEELLRLRFRHDFPFWASTCVYIKRKGGGSDTRFFLNPPQRKLVEAFEKQRLASKPIRITLLKARQWGGSTCSQLYMAWLQLLHQKGLNSLIIAHQGAASDEIKDMFDRMIDAYPIELLYPQGEDIRLDARKMQPVGKSGSIFRVPARNCKVKIGTAERPNSCRGGDYNLVHLSEVGLWPSTEGKSPEDIVRSACGGILLAPLTMVVYESTANGVGNFFHREYMAAARGESQFAPLFISWFEIPQYSLSLSPAEEADFARSLFGHRLSESSSPRAASGAYLWRLFRMGASLQAIAWYVEERKKYNDDADMAAEYPSDDVEAFSHSGCRVFDRSQVEALRDGCSPPLWRGEVTSPLPDSPECLSSIRFTPMQSGGLEIWEMPPEEISFSERYLTVVDVGGRSAKADWSVIAVFDRAPMSSGGIPAIVAQWRGHCDADTLAWKAARIAAFYQNSLLAVESNTLESRDSSRLLDGDQLPYILLQIRDAYPNLYMRAAAPDAISGKPSLRLGFHTNSRTKPLVISTLVRGVREKLYAERCEAALDEMLTYERRANGSFGAIEGAHDDILMTRAIGLHIALHEMDLPRLIRRSSPQSPLSPSGPRRQTPCDLAF